MHDVQFERANRIVAENQRLREGIEALANSWAVPGRPSVYYTSLRALLSTSSVRGEGDG